MTAAGKAVQIFVMLRESWHKLNKRRESVPTVNKL